MLPNIYPYVPTKHFREYISFSLLIKYVEPSDNRFLKIVEILHCLGIPLEKQDNNMFKLSNTLAQTVIEKAVPSLY